MSSIIFFVYGCLQDAVRNNNHYRHSSKHHGPSKYIDCGGKSPVLRQGPKIAVYIIDSFVHSIIYIYDIFLCMGSLFRGGSPKDI